MGKILEAKEISLEFKSRLQKEVAALGKVCLVSLKIGSDPSLEAYLSAQAKVAAELGIDYVLKSFVAETSEQEVIASITEYNHDDSLAGIIVNKPFPRNFNQAKIFSTIDLRKDIEGVNPCNLGLTMLGHYSFVPPTVLSILEFLKMEETCRCLGGSLNGKEVVIVGASVIIGKPLAMILSDLFATVRLTHVGTYQAGNLSKHIQDADIVISAVGKPGLIKGEWIKENAVVVDVGCGISQDKVCGDVEFEAAKQRAALITPVPGGVGKLTTLFLFDNLVKAAQFKKFVKNINE